MSLLDNGKYNDARTRNIAACVRLCEIGAVREMSGKPTEDGKPVRDVTFVPLTLLEAAKDTEGGDLPVGFPKDAALSSYNDPGDDEKLVQVNDISRKLFRSLVVSALDLPDACPDVHAELMKQGGASALKGKRVLVKWSVKNDRQNVDRFMRVPKTP